MVYETEAKRLTKKIKKAEKKLARLKAKLHKAKLAGGVGFIVPTETPFSRAMSKQLGAARFSYPFDIPG